MNEEQRQQEARDAELARQQERGALAEKLKQASKAEESPRLGFWMLLA